MIQEALFLHVLRLLIFTPIGLLLETVVARVSSGTSNPCVFGGPDDHVVEHRDPDQLPNPLEPDGQVPIFLARLHLAGGVVTG
jgi:hypothetical protein